MMEKRKTFLKLLIVLTVLLSCPRARATQEPRTVDVIILENGIYDSADVLEAIGEYAESIGSSSDYTCNVVKLSSSHNNPAKIDEFIESRHLAGTNIFILVGNDLKWPLSIGYLDDVPVASPADGVLCDTDGELSISGDGLHQPITAFTSEVTVSYVFPPKTGLSAEAQVDLVVNAFEKFSDNHQGKLAYRREGVVCGRFDPDPWPIFHEATESMASASERMFGPLNVVKKELAASEVRTYLERAPAFFGVAGHGSTQVVETSSTGDLLSHVDLTLSSKGPKLLEVFGCWASGWYFQDAGDPWGARAGFFSEAAIFGNEYSIAMICGNPGPESRPEYSFSGLVLSLVPSHPGAAIGELMIGKERRSTDWVYFGDPIMRPDDAGNGPVNQRPVAYVDLIGPSPSMEGAEVVFEGHAADGDGEVVGYRWWSSLDGVLSERAAFSTSSLSVGTHEIRFRAQDDYGDWSEEVVEYVTIVASFRVNILYPEDGDQIKGTVVVSASTNIKNIIAFNFYIDGAYKGYDANPPYEYEWDTTRLSNGPHTVQVKAYSRTPVKTYSSAPITVNTDNPLPTVTVTSPLEGSELNGACPVEVVADDVDKVSRVRFYVDGLVKGYDYSPPFQWSWDTGRESHGTHTVRVDAYYTNLLRYISSESVDVFVNNPRPSRSVEIISLSDGDVVSGTIQVDVEATGEDLIRVYLYLDGKYKGFDGVKPYGFRLNTAQLPSGPHEIYAVGLYEKNPPHTKIKSEIINITVNNLT